MIEYIAVQTEYIFIPLTSTSVNPPGEGELERELGRELARELDVEDGRELGWEVWELGRRDADVGRDVGRELVRELGWDESSLVILEIGANIPDNQETAGLSLSC